MRKWRVWAPLNKWKQHVLREVSTYFVDAFSSLFLFLPPSAVPIFPTCLSQTRKHTHFTPPPPPLTILPSCSHFSDLQQEYYNVSAPHKSRWQGRAALHLSTETPHFLSPPPSFYHTLPCLHSLFCLPRSLGDRHMAPHQRRRTSTAALSPGCVFLNLPLIGMSITTQQWALCALSPPAKGL